MQGRVMHVSTHAFFLLIPEMIRGSKTFVIRYATNDKSSLDDRNQHWARSLMLTLTLFFNLAQVLHEILEEAGLNFWVALVSAIFRCSLQAYRQTGTYIFMNELLTESVHYSLDEDNEQAG